MRSQVVFVVIWGIFLLWWLEQSKTSVYKQLQHYRAIKRHIYLLITLHWRWIVELKGNSVVSDKFTQQLCSNDSTGVTGYTTRGDWESINAKWHDSKHSLPVKKDALLWEVNTHLFRWRMYEVTVMTRVMIYCHYESIPLAFDLWEGTIPKLLILTIHVLWIFHVRGYLVASVTM